MQTNHAVQTPGITKEDVHSPTSSTFVITPLHTGYGMTLGNSMRRVLLSSISGAAVKAFKIEGATHEFTTVKGVKEDAVDILLNLKKLRFKVFNDEPQLLRIEKKGAGQVTAADIKVTSDVEVVNTDQVIATLDDSKSALIMDLIVESGRGYLTVEEMGENDKPSDMIAVDALFSPVLRVRYKVEHTRVGRITNLDKLSITVDTDGTITPNDAFEEAAAILKAQYAALAGSTTVETITHEEPAKTPARDEEPSELMTPIENLNLTARTTNALINNDIHTVQDLVTLGDAELKELKGFGAKALDEVQEKLDELEL
ncbi:TPA: DNA-directed RNA polymerase subunit alpha [Candidatus Saccharibacteria bacterium]|nr:DNA-directed RNA polymerase subunit alpha [Candidatus Saccharibacteria bacterium]HIO87374.1 DNA-directed RNA polymerase subunit alpha [Candidatus Saccharibacteria bacterium]